MEVVFMKRFIIAILTICSFASLYALDTKYIPNETALAISINPSQVLQKLDRQSTDILTKQLSSSLPVDFYMIKSFISGSSGVDPKDNIYMSVIDSNTSVIILSLNSGDSFERFLVDEYRFSTTRHYGDYKALMSYDNKVLVAYNNEAALMIPINSSNNNTHNQIAINTFANSKRADATFDNLPKSTDDVLLIADIDSLLAAMDEDILSDLGVELKQRYELSLRFDQSDITLELDVYDYKGNLLAYQPNKAFNRLLYKYINGNKNISFFSLSMNLEQFYKDAEVLFSMYELAEFEAQVIEEFGMTISQMLQAFTGNMFLSLWDLNINKEEFDGIFSIEINNQIYYQKIMDVLVQSGMLLKSNISGKNIYQINNIAIYQEGNILYISTYEIIRDIANGNFSSTPNTNISTLTEKNMFSFYVDLQKLISIWNDYDSSFRNEKYYNIINQMDNFSITTNVVGNGLIRTTSKLELRQNKSNSINWLILLFDNM